MLYIITDVKDKSWLVYILDEFRRINRADFEIRVFDSHDTDNLLEEQNVIYYTKEFNAGLSLVNKSDLLPEGIIKGITEEIFVVEGTQTDDKRFACAYDLFWNSFVFLSRLEEYLAANNGRGIRSYLSKHPRRNKESFRVAVVNNIFNELEDIIKSNFAHLTFSEKKEPIIELSHDVDYVTKTPQLFIKQTSFNIYNSLKALLNLNQFIERCSKTFKFVFSTPSYWCFDYWRDYEKKIQRRSTFYIYVKTGRKNLKSWLLDPSYDILRDKKLVLTLKELIADGFEIGLHGSFYSATDKELLTREKQMLEKILGRRVNKVRQHWLRYEEKITPYIHDGLFDYDATLGFNDAIGFRAACASNYHPYDHINKKAFSFFVIPQVIMDSNIYDYGGNMSDSFISASAEILKGLCNYKSAHIAICWHQRVCNDDYMWNKAYEQLIPYEDI